MRSAALEVTVPDGEPRISRSLWDRPAWVLKLGIYGRAAYEWRRAQDPLSLDLLEDPVSLFRMIEVTVSDRVRLVVQAWLRARQEPGATVAGLPEAFAESEADQLAAATRAAEIGPCLELVFQPAPAAPGDLIGGEVRPARLEVELLTTVTWETRPSLTDLRSAASALAEALAGGETAESLPRARFAPVTMPTALFPTELRVATQHLNQALGRTEDLYLLFN